MDRIDQSGLNGLDWTEEDRIYQTRPNWIEWTG